MAHEDGASGSAGQPCDTVAVVCSVLRERYADQALAIAQSQASAATGKARVTWKAVRAILEGEQAHLG